MTNPHVNSFRDRLDSLFDRIEGFHGDMELQAHWARYLCVLCSGYLEEAVRTIYGTHVRSHTHSHVANYVETTLQGFQNPNMEKILKLTGAFKPEWRRKLESETEGELKDAVDSIVANRHLIAHGRNVGLTYATVKSYYTRAKKVISLIERNCEGES